MHRKTVGLPPLNSWAAAAWPGLDDVIVKDLVLILLGKFDSLSYMEMRLILGRLLWHFDIQCPDGAEMWNPEGEMKNMRAYNTWEKPELNIKVTSVKR